MTFSWERHFLFFQRGLFFLFSFLCGSPGSWASPLAAQSQLESRTEHPGASFFASFCQIKCVWWQGCASSLQSQGWGKRLCTAKAEVMWDEMSPDFPSTDDMWQALKFPAPFGYPRTPQSGLGKIRDRMGTIPHLTLQEQRHRAAHSPAKLNTWPACPLDVERDQAFPFVPHPQAAETTLK